MPEVHRLDSSVLPSGQAKHRGDGIHMVRAAKGVRLLV